MFSDLLFSVYLGVNSSCLVTIQDVCVSSLAVGSYRRSHKCVAECFRQRFTELQLPRQYEGSVTIDKTLLMAAGILPYEHIHVWNITRGTRLETYVIEGEQDSGEICINGAAAHLHQPGDLVILATFADMEEAEAKRHHPTVIRVDEKNRIVGFEPEQAGPKAPLEIPKAS